MFDDYKIYPYTDKYGNEYDIAFVKGKYYNDNLAIEMYCQDLSERNPYWEDYATLTVNLDFLPDQNMAAIDTNNLGEEIIDWLENNDIAYRTGQTIPSGFCIYPLVRFSNDFLNQISTEEEY